jgi:hypothetical protein
VWEKDIDMREYEVQGLEGLEVSINAIIRYLKLE